MTNDNWDIPKAPKTTTGEFMATLATFTLKNTEAGPELSLKLVVSGEEAAMVAGNLSRLKGTEVQVALSAFARQLVMWE